MKIEPMCDDVSDAGELLGRYASARARLWGPVPPQAAFPAMLPEPEKPEPEPDWRPEMWDAEPEPPRRIVTRRIPRIPTDMPFEGKVAVVLEHIWRGGAGRLHRLLVVISRVFDISIDDLRGPSRHREQVIPRQIAMVVAVEALRLSLPEAGRFIGRDHTTVIHARRKYGELVREIESRRAE
jgi:hypothetical protein